MVVKIGDIAENSKENCRSFFENLEETSSMLTAFSPGWFTGVCAVVWWWCCGGVLLAWLLHVGMVVWSLTVEVRRAWFVLMVCAVIVCVLMEGL